MTETLSAWLRRIWLVSAPVISSPGLAGGPSPSSTPTGPSTGPSGRGVAPVNPSAPPGGVREPPTLATCGPSGSDLSKSAILTWWLANKLRRRLGTAGSTLFVQTWREKVTPAGRWYWAHTASGRRTSDNGCGGWPSPDVNGGGPASPELIALRTLQGKKTTVRLEAAARLASWSTTTLAGWPTATKQDAGSSGVAGYPASDSHHTGTTLTDAAKLAGWISPRHHDGLAGVDPSANPKDLTTQASWAIPAARDYRSEEATPAFNQKRWASPRANKWGEPDSHGKTSGGFLAETASGGQLNPAFSLWLMGYPIAWARCAARVTRLSPKRARPSSART